MAARLLTVGHSNLELATFLAMLALHGVEALADVRSRPYSRFAPQFNRDVLEAAMRRVGIRYVFLGEELGARRGEPGCYVEGKARYELIAREPLFQRGLDRVRQGAERFRVAMMCAEKDPLTCHRTILVCRQLRPFVRISHILENGNIETAEQAEDRLLDMLGLPAGDLFHPKEAFVERAYDLQGDRIAYTQEQENPTLEAAG